MVVKSRIFNGIVFLYFGFFAVITLGFAVYWHDFKKAPEQPIDFSHELHVGQLKFACTLCHQTVERAISASVPPLSKCMECHKAVATDKEEVKKLTQYWENQEPIPWEKVYSVPEHVYFSHKRHIKAGLDCSNCHGELAAQARVRKVTTLKMGFCIDCHKARDASRDCYTCHK